jgi:hypothetical protein
MITGALAIAFLRQCPQCKRGNQSFAFAFCSHCGTDLEGSPPLKKERSFTSQEIVSQLRLKTMNVISVVIWAMGLCIVVFIFDMLRRQSTQISLLGISSLVGFVGIFFYSASRFMRCPICEGFITGSRYCNHCGTCLCIQKS